MRQLTLAFALIVPLGLALAGCNKSDDHDHDHDHGDHSHDDGHGHDHGDDGHDHGAEGGDHADAHKAEIKLAPITIGDFTVNAVSLSEIKPGKMAHLDIVVTGGDVSALRLWAGDEAATGVAKEKADLEEAGKFHGHADIPDPIGDAKLWVEIEAADGTRTAGSTALTSHE